VQRVRPKMMTVFAILLGSFHHVVERRRIRRDEANRRTMVGGIVTSSILELLIYPAIYVLWKWWSEVRPAHAGANDPGLGELMNSSSQGPRVLVTAQLPLPVHLAGCQMT